ncbi:MAG: heavy metal-associated domain-containing protein [Gaiellaceae bacterium]
MTELQLKVDGMHCASCALLIEEELEELDGVTEAKASFRKQEARVVLDDARVVPAILEKISELGYRARVVE